MASPRSSWSGTICLDLVTIPVTLAKATKTIREQSLVTVCAEHKTPINRSERCGAGHDDCGLTKVKAVDLDGKYKLLSENQYAHIEDSTKDDRLQIFDAQPIASLPLAFGLGTYYVRAKKDDRAAAGGLAALTLALGQTGMGCVTKLCKSAKQDFAILHPYKGVMLMTLVPFVDALNTPGEQEKAHMKVNIDDRTVERVADLLVEIRNEDGFDYSAYADDGLRLRQEAVDRVIAGEKLEEAEEQEPEMVPDILDQLAASMNKRQKVSA